MRGLFLNIGSVVSGLVSATCCLGPAVFAGLGVGAGTAGFLGGMAGFAKSLIPYRSFFIAVALGLIALTFWKVYGRQGTMCAAGDMNSLERLKRQKIGLWITSAVVMILILSPYWLGVIS